MERIQELLDAASDPGSENQLTLTNVKRWLSEYMEMRAEEDDRFPDEAGANHWDLIAADYDTSKEAQFIAAYFSACRVTFLAGRGPVIEVQAFAQETYPDNPDDVLDALTSRFNTGERWTTDADSIITWADS
jgi:hypothetical protein